MRRTLPLLLAATLAIAACGGDDGGDDATDTTEATDTTDAGTTGEAAAPTTAELSAPPTNPDKPEVELPAAPPDELAVKVIEEGSGPEAEAGDTVIVDYIGVRSSDGVEFDNSYDRFEPFPVVLGQGAVIQGWDQGLLEAQAGSRIQLDIPSDLAYGAEARGEVIGENEDLTFVIDVRAVIKPPAPEDAPTEAGVPESEGAEDTTFVDLVEGDGDELESGQTGVLNYVLFRGDNLVQLESSWVAEPVQIGTAVGNFPGFVEGLPGMKVGGRRAIIIPPEDGFGPDGNPQLGLPAGSDMIIVVDLLGVYGTPTE
jgi:peptidylprolyl isomerase